MSNTTKYFSLQGRVSFATRDGSGNPGVVRWAQNCPKFEISIETDEETVKESHSGLRLEDFNFPTGISIKTAYTLHGFNIENLAQALWATKYTVNASTASNEVAPLGLVAGDIIKLDHENVSAVTAVDSTGSPVTLVAGTDFEVVSAFAGHIRILNVGGLTQPFKFSYSYATTNALALMKGAADEVILMFDGVNTANQEKVYLELYRHRAKPTSGLALINDGVGTLEFEGSALYDGTRATDPNLGTLGRMVFAG